MKRLCTLFVVTLAAVAQADTVYLKDGTRLEGDVKRGDRSYVVTRADGKYQVVPLDQVKSIEMLGGTTQPADVARENLASLRRSVEHDYDVNRIIDRYINFITRNKDTAAVEQARQDLAVWQQRRDGGLVKYGARWVTPQEREKLAEKTLQTADAARRLLKNGQFKEAETTINQALADDPKNATALYLKGLLQYQQDQLVPARKTFEQVNTLVPNHGPTLNNLAVILARQNQGSPALTMYDQAMMSSPKERRILDNVAEMLNAVPDEQRGSPLAQRVARRFTEQDIDLQKEMEKQGLHRWGANWVTSEQLDQLKSAERAVKDQLDRLSDDFDATKVRIGNVDRDIEENDRAMRRLEASSYVRDLNGNIYQSVLPATYYQLQDDNVKLRRERDEQYAKLEQLRRQARAVQQDLPVPKYTGIQRVIDAGGAPTIVPVAPVAPVATPATQPGVAPSTQPSA